MFSLARRRREAERHKKLEEAFTKADTNGNGKITAEQMIKIFEVNDVVGKLKSISFNLELRISLPQKNALSLSPWIICNSMGIVTGHFSVEAKFPTQG